MGCGRGTGGVRGFVIFVDVVDRPGWHGWGVDFGSMVGSLRIAKGVQEKLVCSGAGGCGCVYDCEFLELQALLAFAF